MEKNLVIISVYVFKWTELACFAVLAPKNNVQSFTIGSIILPIGEFNEKSGVVSKV